MHEDGGARSMDERPGGEPEGVVASGLELVEVDEVERLLARLPGGIASLNDGSLPPFSAGELAYARARSDPARRLAARLAAKRAAAAVLGPGIAAADVTVDRGRYGPPVLRFSPRARARLEALGARGALVSLTHERKHAAAAVLLLRDER